MLPSLTVDRICHLALCVAGFLVICGIAGADGPDLPSPTHVGLQWTLHYKPPAAGSLVLIGAPYGKTTVPGVGWDGKDSTSPWHWELEFCNPPGELMQSISIQIENLEGDTWGVPCNRFIVNLPENLSSEPACTGPMDLIINETLFDFIPPYSDTGGPFGITVSHPGGTPAPTFMMSSSVVEGTPMVGTHAECDNEYIEVCLEDAPSASSTSAAPATTICPAGDPIVLTLHALGEVPALSTPARLLLAAFLTVGAFLAISGQRAAKGRGSKHRA